MCGIVPVLVKGICENFTRYIKSINYIVIFNMNAKRKYLIELTPSGKKFQSNEGETILDAALRSDVKLPHSCKDGTCGACKGRVLSGEFHLDTYRQTLLTIPEREDGYTLFCRTKPISDMSIEIDEIEALRDIVVKTLPARVEKIDRISENVTVLTLRLPKTENFKFLPGQYIDILLKNGEKRSYSIANASADSSLLEFHIRDVPGGCFSEYVRSDLKEKELLRFKGPFGTFFLRDDPNTPIIFIATGTGFAPIKSILEQAFSTSTERKITLYWGCRNLSEMYMRDLPIKWERLHSNFSFIPVLSEPKLEDDWQGRTGLVHEVVLQDVGDFSSCQVYACGAPMMIEAARDNFAAFGLSMKHFFSDPFFASSSAASE